MSKQTAITALIFLTAWLSACSFLYPSPTDILPTPTIRLATITFVVGSPTPTTRSTVTTKPTQTPPPNTASPVSSPTKIAVTVTMVTKTPPSLPLNFQTSILAPGVSPQEYIKDSCQYLKQRWAPANSPPGTIVMPVMFHSITGDENPLSPDGSQIHVSDFNNFMESAWKKGFSTITSEQLVNFLENNAKIPQRSLMLILDDRRPGVTRVNFLPYLIKYNWTLTLAWLIGDTDTRSYSPIKEFPKEKFTGLWEQMEYYNSLGYLDFQAHGYIHNSPIDDFSTKEYIRHEIVDPRSILQEHFSCKNPLTQKPIENCQKKEPLALIWPGGGFSQPAAEVARQAGYHIGFTVNPRGPLMYNWIPLASERIPSGSLMKPEISVGDPLMVLPRYWSKDALQRLDDVISIGADSVLFSEQNKAKELEYFKAVCKPLIGSIPGLEN